MNDDLRPKMTAVLNDPRLQRNLKGRLAALLRLIDNKTQQRLAIDFAERVVASFDAGCVNGYSGTTLLETLRHFLDGRLGIDAIIAACREFYDSYYGMTDRCKSAAGAGDVMHDAIAVVALHGLKAAGEAHTTCYQPNAIDVAMRVLQTIERQDADHELEWQIQHVCQTIAKVG